MAAAAPNASFECDIDIEDVEYLRHGDTQLLARLFKPRGNDRFRQSSSSTAVRGASGIASTTPASTSGLPAMASS